MNLLLPASAVLLTLAFTSLPLVPAQNPAPAPGPGTRINSRQRLLNRATPLPNGVQLSSSGTTIQVTALRDDLIRVRASNDGHIANLPNSGYMPYETGTAGDHFVKNPYGTLALHIAAPEGTFTPWWHQLRIDTIGWTPTTKQATTKQATSNTTTIPLEQSGPTWSTTIPTSTTRTDLLLK